jgi:CHC2 zinc finger
MADRGRKNRGRGKRFSAAELDRLKDARSLSSVFEACGHRSKGRGREKWLLCPFHKERTASCKIDDEEGYFYCHGCGASGDHFDALMLLRGYSFAEAVEFLGGRRDENAGDTRIDRPREVPREPAPESPPPPSLQRIFDSAKPILGTQAAAYLMTRSIPVVPGNTLDLRYAEALPYHGYPDPAAEDSKELGRFPAMIAAIRNVAGDLIGLHRTYLEPSKPSKLNPPGDRDRNQAKKVMGRQRGGLIYLSPPSSSLAIGEGIETTQSWYALGRGGPDVAIASGISLGNLAGGSTGTIPHPEDLARRIPPQKCRRIPNGEPDLERESIILPPWAKEVILLGDGDSERVLTHARLLIAGRRFEAQGVGVFVDMAPDGVDFNNLLQEGEQEGAAL